ncbi:hypothetical protein M011DRAFT_480195 [Sporormia fimetaria CBS 119925]|uniref:DH domain-containing protein n=1 Tax=Sporormia fimetaria CBS 119925 TaxID=1340428 RepID=A0A6A6V3F7_9PLEO|nr:hypothetical protein M011DRAFT_480195 [Sporormia fimetaria CBS 119925]
MHNYAYNPTVANWVQSTSLATHLDPPPDDQQEPSPDDFYRVTSAPADYDTMTSTRQRQVSAGALSTAKSPYARTSPLAPAARVNNRSSPQLPANRPTVKTLAQKFNQTTPTEPSPAPSSRVRSVRPSPGSRSVSDSLAASSPARATRENAYGPHKFNNLKPRERPQPAPSPPSSSRRPNSAKKSAEEQTPSPRRKASAGSGTQSSTVTASRKPFFGEVVDHQDVTSPGYGIPGFDYFGTGEAEPVTPVDTAAAEPAPLSSALSPTRLSHSAQSPLRHKRSPSNFSSASAGPRAAVSESPASHAPRRRSPPSRIPVASRRQSTASDSSSSIRSSKASSARPPGAFDRSSPRHNLRRPSGTNDSNPSKQSRIPSNTLPPTSYRDPRERGKSPKTASSGRSLAAAVSPSAQPPSPRLRNSRERQMLTKQSLDHNSPTRGVKDAKKRGDVQDGRTSSENMAAAADRRPKDKDLSPRVTAPNAASVESPRTNAHPEASPSGAQPEPLTLRTTNPQPSNEEPRTSTTTEFDYEESPILGMPGSFMTTPPMQHTPPTQQEEPPQPPPPRLDATPREELLQPLAFEPPKKVHRVATPMAEDMDNMPSELGVRESIPIMLGGEETTPHASPAVHSPRDISRLSVGPQKWRAEPLDASGTISYLEEDDSPIDPFSDRDTVLPEDSASVAFYNRAPQRPTNWKPDVAPIPSVPGARGLSINAEVYNVINNVLHLYHSTTGPDIDPEIANELQKQVQQVSPVLAQHNDWCSKEATETYLVRLLSDANGGEQEASVQQPPKPEQSTVRSESRPGILLPSVSFRGLVEDPAEPQVGGTAIIFPSESRRYSRGSRGSTATTIQDDSGRLEDNPERSTLDPSPNAFDSPYLLQPTTFTPLPPPNDSFSSQDSVQRDDRRQNAPSGTFLPEIDAAGEGLGLSLDANRQKQSQQHRREDEDRVHGQQSGSVSKKPVPASAYQHTPPQTRQSAVASSTPLSSKNTPDSQPIYLSPTTYKPAFETLTDGANSADERTRASPRVTDATGLRPQSGRKPRSMPGSPKLERAKEKANELSPQVDEAQKKLDKGKGRASVIPPQVEKSPIVAAQASFDGAIGTPSTSANAGQGVSGTHPAAFPGEDEEAIKRRLRHRCRILEELCRTENDYMSDLMVISQIWLGTAKEAWTNAQERATVFCNIEELSEFTSQVNVDLKNAFKPIAFWKNWNANGSDDGDDMGNKYDPEYVEPDVLFANCTLDNDDKTSVGYVLKYYLADFETLYTRYLLNHDRATKIITEKVKSDDPVYIGWQHACHKGSKDITDAWDLDSLLVKPVQRLMKYPLLLQSLKEVTPPTHGDYNDIEAARQGMIDINNRINETKKRQETLRQATKEGKKEKKKGFRGIDIVKALTSKDKAKTLAADAFTDAEYDEQSQKFGGNFFQLQIILKDFDHYRDEITSAFVHLNIVALQMVALLEEQPSTSPELESAWRRNAMALLELRNVLLEDHKQAVYDQIYKPLQEVWSLYVKPQKLMDQRKKGLVQYTKYKQALERKEKVDPKLEEAAQQFVTVNDALKEELPKLYTLTKKAVQAILRSFVMHQKLFWKNCQKKILPIMENEPEHTNSFAADMRSYVARFMSDFKTIQADMDRLGLANGGVLTQIANFQSPHPSLYTADDSSSRKSTSRRTESMGSEMSSFDQRHRRSTGQPSQRTMPSFEGPPRSAQHAQYQAQHRTAGDQSWEPPATSSSRTTTMRSANRHMPQYDGPGSPPVELGITKTTTNTSNGNGGRSSLLPFPKFDDAFHEPPAALAAPRPGPSHSYSTPASSRTSAIFQSALPMDPPSANRSVEELPVTPAGDPDEPEVLFLAASLFEFNIAHDRREGGIPYLVYVPGEIFDVIGMKGELWLARNQDDPSRTVGWIWEKHFARILPEET